MNLRIRNILSQYETTKWMISMLILLSITMKTSDLRRVSDISVFRFTKFQSENSTVDLAVLNSISNEKLSRALGAIVEQSLERSAKFRDANGLMKGNQEHAGVKNTKVNGRELTEVILQESRLAGVDPLLVAAVIQHESRFSVRVRGLHGEIGLMQILPKTGVWISKKMGMPLKSEMDLFDPIVNVKVGISYLAWLSAKYNNVRYTLTAYNMGPRNVQKIIAKGFVPNIYYDKVFNQYKSIVANIERIENYKSIENIEKFQRAERIDKIKDEKPKINFVERLFSFND